MHYAHENSWLSLFFLQIYSVPERLSRRRSPSKSSPSYEPLSSLPDFGRRRTEETDAAAATASPKKNLLSQAAEATSEVLSLALCFHFFFFTFLAVPPT